MCADNLQDSVLIYTTEMLNTVTCLTADLCLTADPGVASSIPARSHTCVEIDHEIISTAISSLQLIQEGLLSVTGKSMFKNDLLTA